MPRIKTVFGANIKYYRKKQGLSQEELAEKLGITPKHLSGIETGATFVSAELLEKFTEKLRVSVSALFYSVDETFTDDTVLGKIDRLIEDEFSKTANEMKIKIRYLHNQ